MARRMFPLPSLVLTLTVLAFGAAGACTVGGDTSLDELASGQGEDGDGDQDDPSDPAECGCEELLEECQQSDDDWQCDGTMECDPGCSEEGQTEDGEECQSCQNDGDCGVPPEGVCEDMYQECVELCEQPPEEDVCDYCESHLDECLAGAEGSDNPESSAEQCYAHYQLCQSECADQDDGGDDGDHDGDEDGDGQPDTGEGCYDQFEECLSECSSDEERAECEMQLNECLENCG